MQEIVGPAGPGPPLTEAERARAREILEGYRERFGLEEGGLPFGVPARKPPLRALYFDETGRLWVEVNVEGGGREAHVYAPDGTPEARYTWPEAVALDGRGWIGREEAIGVRVDSAGVAGTSGEGAEGGGAGAEVGGEEVGSGAAGPVERLVRLRLPPPGGP